MSSSAKRKATLPAAGTPAPVVPKTKTPTPDAGSPAADQASEPAENFSGAHWLQQGLPEEDDADSTI